MPISKREVLPVDCSPVKLSYVIVEINFKMTSNKCLYCSLYFRLNFIYLFLCTCVTSSVYVHVINVFRCMWMWTTLHYTRLCFILATAYISGVFGAVYCYFKQILKSPVFVRESVNFAQIRDLFSGGIQTSYLFKSSFFKKKNKFRFGNY